MLCVVKTFIKFASPFNLLSFFSSFMYLLPEAVRIIESHYYIHNCFWGVLTFYICVFLSLMLQEQKE